MEEDQYIAMISIPGNLWSNQMVDPSSDAFDEMSQYIQQQVSSYILMGSVSY